jgi:hypothetical protein
VRTFVVTLIVCLIAAGAALAAGIDGKWYSERKMERDGQAVVIKQTFDLKSSGSQLTGKITVAFGDMEPRSVDIKDGKIDGSKFSFTTVMEFNGNQIKTKYEGSVDGDTLKGNALREGGQGGGQARPFEAKRK